VPPSSSGVLICFTDEVDNCPATSDVQLVMAQQIRKPNVMNPECKVLACPDQVGAARIEIIDCKNVLVIYPNNC
jgi:hypothetical protein